MPSERVQAVLSRLKKVRRAGDGWLARCPAHEDREPSLSIGEGADGRVLLSCKGPGCSPQQIMSAIGLTMADLFPSDTQRPLGPPPRAPTSTPPVFGRAVDEEPDERSEQASWPVVETYDYVDADGALVFQVLRKEPAVQPATGKRRKTFFQRRPDGAGGWIPNLRDIARPLFRLPELLEDLAAERTILLVEGEKDVNTLRAIGFAATTNAGGSKAWQPAYSAVLGGADVVVLPDDDEPGRTWAATAGESLAAAGARVRMLALPSSGAGSDASDWLGAGGTHDALELLIARAQPWSSGDPVPEPPKPSRFRILSDVDVERLPPVQFLVESVLPTMSLAALYGPPSAGKSFVALDLACAIGTGQPWFGRRVVRGAVLYVLAEGSAGITGRIQAWKHAHGRTDQPLGVYFIAETANLMDAADVEHVRRAVTALNEPIRLIIFDTLHRSMPGGEENSAKDLGIVIEHADRIRRSSGAAVMLVHHSRKDSDQERGSTALRGAVDTLLAVRDEDDRRILSCEKQKDAASFDAIPLALEPFMGSCVLRIAREGDDDATKPLTPFQRAALQSLSRDFLSDGALSSEWLAASGIAQRTFYRARGRLVRDGFVLEIKKGPGSRFLVSSKGHVELTLQRRTATTATATATELGSATAPGVGAYVPPTRGGTTPHRAEPSRGSDQFSF